MVKREKALEERDYPVLPWVMLLGREEGTTQ
jgi:hypothetical protein